MPGIIQEEAEVNAGGEMKFFNAVQRGVVKMAGGLFFFPNVHFGSSESTKLKDTAHRT